MLLPDCPALVLVPGGAVCVHLGGEIEELDRAAGLARLTGADLGPDPNTDLGPDPGAGGGVLVCHGAFAARRLGGPAGGVRFGPGVLDILELHAFVRPAQFCLPTPKGLARHLGLARPGNGVDEALCLHRVAAHLLRELASPNYPDRRDTLQAATTLGRAGWGWGTAVLAALGGSGALQGVRNPALAAAGPLAGVNVWTRLKDWEEVAPRPPAGHAPVSPEEARARLGELTGPDAEARPVQADYAAEAARAFAPRRTPGTPHIVLAEASTGTGKTLGYIAPASLWAARNKGTVWISTFTKNLQRQLDQELSRLYPDPAEKARKAVIRKGRENYLCLLNFEEFAQRALLSGQGVLAGLIARWARYSRDGDMVGGDFPAWLLQTSGRRADDKLQGGLRRALTDRRGECIYSSCPHYKKCFVEKAVRKARQAEIVIANHALVMAQAALDMPLAGHPTQKTPADDADTKTSLTRLIFDEGHHLFTAADSAFATRLSLLETSDLRRWLRGPEDRASSRNRGLSDRIDDFLTEETEAALGDLLSAAMTLPSPGWTSRLTDNPKGPAERFFSLVYRQILARANEPRSFYSLETETRPLDEEVAAAGVVFGQALARFRSPVQRLISGLKKQLNDGAGDLETPVRLRIEAVLRGLERRGLGVLPTWEAMLGALQSETPDDFTDWFSLERISGRDHDVALNRHWTDPTKPFAEALLEPAHGVIITSATLNDEARRDSASDGPSGDPAEDPTEDPAEDLWQSGEVRTGAVHLPVPAIRARFASPFNYNAQARIFIVRDVSRTDTDQVAAAYRELFLAAGGGGLGLFTAINRLAGVHAKLQEPLAAAGVPLYAQHMDAMDTGTLVDIFRAEENSCLLGTDAVRDGIDVPGASLRMMVLDRTPWPRPDILHKARKAKFGGARYDDMITRLRLAQAFGRLIRSARDRGVFVILDARVPTRLTSAFPPDIEIARVGLAEAIEASKAFLGPSLAG